MESTQKLVEFQTTSAKPVEDQQTDHEADVGEEEVSNEEPQQQHDLPVTPQNPGCPLTTRQPAEILYVSCYKTHT